MNPSFRNYHFKHKSFHRLQINGGNELDALKYALQLQYEGLGKAFTWSFQLYSNKTTKFTLKGQNSPKKNYKLMTLSSSEEYTSDGDQGPLSSSDFLLVSFKIQIAIFFSAQGIHCLTDTAAILNSTVSSSFNRMLREQIHTCTNLAETIDLPLSCQ